MSEETTQDITPKYDTKPTIETVLELINALGKDMHTRIDNLEEKLNIRLDRIESEVKQTRSEFLTLRADFTELKGILKEHLPTVG